TGDDLSVRIAVELVSAHRDATQEVGIVSEEASQEGSVGDLPVGLEQVQLCGIDDFHERPIDRPVRCGSVTGNDDWLATNSDGGHEDAAAGRGRRRVGEEGTQ